MTIHPDIQQAVEAIRVIDTHEHLEEETDRLARRLDFASLFSQYAEDDLRVAGMSEADHKRCFADDTPLDEKWRLFEPHYRAARNTAYLKAVEIAIADLYGIEELNARTVRTLTERLEQRNKPGVLTWILKERCGIDHAQVNSLAVTFFPPQTDRSLFRQDLLIVQFLNWPIPFEALQKETGVAVDSLGGYADALDALFARYGPQAVAIKQQSAYWRPQHFEDVPDAEAGRGFAQARRDPDAVSPADRKKLQDWGFHRCIRNAIQHDLPIKIHTGYKVSINYMDTGDIRPTDLTNLFIQYPEAKFSLFHIGYPYQDEVVALAKHFTNVYVDLCWAWIIDPVATRQFLAQFLTAVPANKLFAFGGDYILAEPVYGHLRIARDNITRLLSNLVDEGYFTVTEAVAIARRILRQNAVEVFGSGK
ncbi:MAG: amidohydrolase family protein [bacterium]|nr:amidohydrolase family protein [bacterium]